MKYMIQISIWIGFRLILFTVFDEKETYEKMEK